MYEQSILSYRFPLAWISGCGLSGVLLALTDQFLLMSLGAATSTDALMYAAAMNLIAGTLVGVGLAIMAMLWMSKAGRAFALLGILGTVWFLNAPLFDGEQIRRLDYVRELRLGTIIALTIACWLAIRLCGFLERRALYLRALLHGVYLVGILFMGLVNLGRGFASRFNNYEAFKLESSVVALVLGAAFFSSLLNRFLIRPRVGVIAPIFLLTLALCTTAYMRSDSAIHQTRSTIRSAPYAATLRLADYLEPGILDRLSPLPPIEFREVDVTLDRLGVAALSKAQTALDRMAPDRGKFNVLWIAIDALRADHCGVYGYTRNTTPTIDALAAESVLFERNVTPTPASNMAYSAVLNGLFGRSSPAYFEAYGLPSPVPEDFSIASAMLRSGRATDAVTAFWRSTQDRPDFAAMKAGFQRFNADGHNSELDASEVTDLALKVLQDRTKEGRPFFSFIHYIDPHAPYTFHDELSFDGDRTALGAYDTEVVFCDAQVGRLLKGIDEMGIRDKTIVVLFSDHGESFGEHNDWRHGASLREHQAHVPLMIRMPGVPPKRVTQWTTLADLPSTTIGLIGAKDPHKRLGRDLSPLIVGTAVEWVDFAYAERPNAPSDGTRSKERAVWSGDLKMSWEPAANSYRVHDLKTDPNELRNIFDQSSEKQGRLAALLKKFDETIDSFWSDIDESATESDTAATEVDPLPAKFEAVIVPLEEARTPVEMKVATVALTDFLRSIPIRWNPEHHARLGVELVDRLRKRAEEVLPVMMSDKQARGLLMLTLLFTDSATSVGVITDAMSVTRNRWILLQSSLFRATKGDATIRPLLEEGYNISGIEPRLRIAAGLRRIGSSVGEDVLRGASWSPARRDATLAISALAASGDPETLLQSLLSDHPIWKQPECEAALLQGAIMGDDFLTWSVLAHLASSGGESVARSAAEALAGKRPDAEVKLRRQLHGSLFQARESIRYSKWPDAVETFLALGDEDIPLVGPYWLLALRAGLVCRNDEAIVRFRGHLKRIFTGHEYLSRVEERSHTAVIDSVSRAPADVDLQARIVKVTVDAKPVVGNSVSIELELRNGSDYLFGGDLRGSVYLALSGGGAKGYRSQMPLPLDGLMPGEVRRVTLWTRIPSVADSYEPDVVLVRNKYERKPKVLATVGAIAIDARKTERAK